METVASKAPPKYRLLDVLSVYYSSANEAIDEQLKRNQHANLVDVELIKLDLEFQLSKAFSLILPTLLVDLHLNRALGLLKGRTPRQRFEYYVRYNSMPDQFAQLQQRYPDSFQIASRISSNIIDNFRTIIALFLKDVNLIRDAFACPKMPRLICISPVGDCHEKGAATSILRLDTGTTLVYKARSSISDLIFLEMIALLDSNSAVPLSRPIQIQRDRYSWHGYVEFALSDDIRDHRQFAFRLGKTLCLLHSLCVTDVHFENVIANRSQVYCVDLETMFHPDIVGRTTDIDSLRLVGILPWYESVPEAPLDLSVLGVRDQRLVPGAGFEFDALNTDQMTLKAVAGRIPAGRCLPTSLNRLLRQDVYFQRHFAEGFTESYKCIHRNRRRVIEILRMARNNRFRVLMRSTAYYQKELTTRALSACRGQVKTAMATKVLQTEFRRVAAYERQSLDLFRIPIFCALPDSREIFTERMGKCGQLAAVAGLQKCLNRLEEMGVLDLAHKLRVIEYSIGRVSKS